MLIKFFLLILSDIILLTSCKGAQEALQGKSRADRSDEFLVEKKNPLSMPPDINQLTSPDIETGEKNINNNTDIKDKLKIKTKNNNNSQNSNSNQKSLNKTILEKINDR